MNFGSRFHVAGKTMARFKKASIRGTDPAPTYMPIILYFLKSFAIKTQVLQCRFGLGGFFF